MRVDLVLDSLAVLSSLWGGTNTPVCAANFRFATRATSEIMRTPTRGAAGRVTAFVDVNVVPMDTEQVLANQTVLVENGRITALAPSSSVKIPRGAVRIDGKEKYLMPGLGEMHFGPMHGLRPPREGKEQIFADELFLRYLTYGITSIRSITSVPESTLPALRRIFAEHPVPRLYLAQGVSRVPVDSVGTRIAAIKAAGYDHLVTGGIYAQSSPEDRARFDATLVAARRVGLPVSTHAHPLPFEASLALGTTGGAVEHLYLFWDSLLGRPGPNSTGSRSTITLPMEKVPALVAAVKRSGVWVNPTLACLELIYPNVKDRGQARIVKALQDAGVKMLLGTDGWGRTGGVRYELTAMLGAGLTPYQALVTGTRHVAEYFRLQDSVGTVSVGKWADLLLLAGNPLEDVRHASEPVGVMIAGRWFDQSALDPNLRPSVQAWHRSKAKISVLIDSVQVSAPAERDAYESLLRRLATEINLLYTTTLAPNGNSVSSDRDISQWLNKLEPRVRAWVSDQSWKDTPIPIPDFTQPAVSP